MPDNARVVPAVNQSCAREVAAIDVAERIEPDTDICLREGRNHGFGNAVGIIAFARTQADAYFLSRDFSEKDADHRIADRSHMVNDTLCV